MTPKLTPEKPETAPDDDPIARLKAGLDEDEAAALAAGSCDYYDDVDECVPMADERKHMLRQTPARVFREVAAKREILDLLDRAARYRDEVFARPEPRSISDEMRAVTTMMTLEAVVKLHADVYVSPGGSLSTT